MHVLEYLITVGPSKYHDNIYRYLQDGGVGLRSATLCLVAASPVAFLTRTFTRELLGSEWVPVAVEV